MIKLIFLTLCLVAAASAVVPWTSNPNLPGYPVFFVGWSSWPYFCDTVNTSNKQCFNDCMNANGKGSYITAANSIAPCPPTAPGGAGGCHDVWRSIGCQCASRCQCKLGLCENASCVFCRR